MARRVYRSVVARKRAGCLATRNIPVPPFFLFGDRHGYDSGLYLLWIMDDRYMGGGQGSLARCVHILLYYVDTIGSAKSLTMITPLIISLTSDFIQHIFLIVLVGVATSEYISASLALRGAQPQDFVAMYGYVKAVRVTLFIILLATLWFVGEYFLETYSLSYRLFLRWPLALSILVAFVIFTKKSKIFLPRIFHLFIVFLTLFIILDIIDYIFHTSLSVIVLAMERIVAMLTFFFSFLVYFIMRRPSENPPIRHSL